MHHLDYEPLYVVHDAISMVGLFLLLKQAMTYASGEYLLFCIIVTPLCQSNLSISSSSGKLKAKKYR